MGIFDDIDNEVLGTSYNNANLNNNNDLFADLDLEVEAEQQRLANRGIIPMAKRTGNILKQVPGNLWEAGKQFVKDTYEGGKQELELAKQGGYNPIEAVGAVGYGTLQGGANLVEGAWNLPGDIRNLYEGQELTKPTHPLTQGLPNLINKTQLGQNLSDYQAYLQGKYPLATTLSQELGEEIPGAILGAGIASKLGKIGNTGKKATSLKDIGYKELAGGSAVGGLGEGLLIDPSSDGTYQTPEERWLNRFTNAGTGAVIAPALNIGTKATLDTIDAVYPYVQQGADYAKEVTGEIIRNGGNGAKFVADEIVNRLNPNNYEQTIEMVPQEMGVGLSQRTEYVPQVKRVYKNPNLQPNTELNVTGEIITPQTQVNQPLLTDTPLLPDNGTGFVLGETGDLIQQLAPNVYKKQQAKANSKPIMALSDKLSTNTAQVEKVARTAPKAIENKQKTVEEQISSLETKIKRVGKDTVLGKKYQKQIEELRNNTTVQQKQNVTNVEPELQTKSGTYTMKNGISKNFEYVEEVPQGYKVLDGATTAPLGYTWYTNGKSLINGRKNILVKDKEIEKNNTREIIEKNLEKAKNTFEMVKKQGGDTTVAENVVKRAEKNLEEYNKLENKEKESETQEEKKTKKTYSNFTNKTGMSMYDDVITDPHYAKVKQRYPKIVKMSPDEYLKLCNEGFNNNYIKNNAPESVKDFETFIKGKTDKQLDRLREAFSQNKPMDIPMIAYETREDGSIQMSSQEGIHRAIVAKEQGISEIPVAIYSTARYDEDVSDDVLLDNLDKLTSKYIKPVENIPSKTREVAKSKRTSEDVIKESRKYQDEVFEKFKKGTLTEKEKLEYIKKSKEFENERKSLWTKENNEQYKKIQKTKSNETQEPKKETDNKIDDVGEFLQGNLKANKALSWKDLENMNDLLLQKNVTKSKAYSKPTIEELKEQGISSVGAGIVLNVYNKINNKPASGYTKKDDYKAFIDSINRVMKETIDYAKNIDEKAFLENIKNYSSTEYKALFNKVFPDKENKKPYNIFRGYPEYNREAIILGGRKFTNSLYFDSTTISDIVKILENAKKSENNTDEKANTKKEKWEKDFVIIEPDRWHNYYQVELKKSKKRLGNKFDTKEEATAFAQRLYETIQETKQQKKNFERDYVERRENNKNITPEELKETFGFRGVNFGNWVNQKERQDFINYTYDSLFDLAELLNLPPKALSLEGQLGIAFGAQGRGGKGAGAGHYIPAYKEINLTKENGAGTLAHEWFHALDNYFGDKSANKEYSGFFSLELSGQSAKGELREELYNALKDVYKAIKETPFTAEDVAKNIESLTKRVNYNIKRYADYIKVDYKRAKNAEELNKIIDDLVENAEKYKTYSFEEMQEIENKFFSLLPENRDTITNRGKFSWLTSELRKLARVEELAQTGAKKSEFLVNAERLNVNSPEMGAGYWSKTHEMGARAFTTYLLDRMEKQSIKNLFLSRNQDGEVSLDLDKLARKLGGEEVEGEIYIPWNPTNTEEKVRIFKAFDKLFDTIQTRETDKGIELYSIEIPEAWRTNNNTNGTDDLDLDSINELISNGTSIRELEEYLPDNVNYFAQNFSDYRVIDMSDKWGYSKKGSHDSRRKIIKLNLKAIGNNPYKFIQTFTHEVEHANQTEYYYRLLKKIDNGLKLTEKELQYIKDFRNSDRRNKIIQRFFNLNSTQKTMKNFFDSTKGMNAIEADSYLYNMKNEKEKKIVLKFKKYYNAYINLFKEIPAREVGENYAKGFKNETREIKRPERNGNSFGWNAKWNSRTNNRLGIRGRERTTEEYSIEENIPDDIDEILPKVKKPSDKVIQKIITPISTRLESISPRIKHAVRKFELDSALTENKYAETVKPFIENLSKMPEADYAKYDLALKNGNVEVINSLNSKYNLSNEYSKIRTLLEEIREKALNVGFNVGYVQDYFPRKVINSAEYLEYLSKNSSFIKEKLKELDPKGTMSNEDKITKINSILKGYNGGITASSSFSKARKVAEITKETNKFYKDSKNALVDYISSMNNAIMVREFFGGENAEVKELRTSLRRKRGTLKDIQDRTPEEAKSKEIGKAQNRLASLNVQLEALQKKKDKTDEEVSRLEELEDKQTSAKRYVGKLYRETAEQTKARLIEDKKAEIKEIEEELENTASEKNLESSVGAYVKGLIDVGLISPSQEVEVRQILEARFNQRGTHGLVQDVKNIGYIFTMGNPFSTITQIGDFAFTLYKNGAFNTMLGIQKAISSNKISREDLGINKIAQEFESDSKTSKLVDKVFKIVGLNKIDSLGKESFINASFNRLQNEAKQAINNPNSKEATKFYNYLNEIFGKETFEVMQDLNNGEVTDNVKYLLFSEISDFQPISLAEMPEAYLRSGNGRIFYMLKTYSIKLLDVYRNEVFKQFKKNPKEGLENLIRLTFLVSMLGVGADTLKDFLMGREINLEETFIDNILKIAMFSKYQVDKSKREGIGRVIMSSIIPPSNVIDDLQKDITDEKFRTGEKGLNELRSIKNIPVLGKAVYWWFGGGLKTKEKELTKIYKDKYIKALQKKDHKEILKISKELNKKNISPQKRKEIYSKARKEYKKDRK